MMGELAEARPYNPERFSPVHPEVVLRLPEGSTRTFWLASMLGNYLKWGGSRRRLQSAEEAAGTLITKRSARRIRDTLGISERRWQELTLDWERSGIAHRCAVAEVFLFARALLDECPACNAVILLGPDAKPNPRSKRGMSAYKARYVRRKSAVGPRILGTEQTHPNSGSPKGLEGYDGAKALEYLHEDSKRRNR